MRLRSNHPEPEPRHDAGDPSRLNLLISYGGWRTSPTIEQLARLLQPLGITSYRAESGEEAAEIIARHTIHIAVVDLAIPFRRAIEVSAPGPGGSRILQILRRLHPTPPTVIVRPPQPAARESARTLSEALREGAFAVLDRPVNLETMLEVMRRVLCRYYADHWPADGLAGGGREIDPTAAPHTRRSDS